MAKQGLHPLICRKCGAEFSTSLALRAHSGHHIKKSKRTLKWENSIPERSYNDDLLIDEFTEAL